MSIKIEFECLKSENNTVVIGGRAEFDNFNLLSTQIEHLLLLQLRKKEKDELKFSLEDKAMVIIYEQTGNIEQQEIDRSSLEDHLINALGGRLKDVDKYLEYLANGQQVYAILFNAKKKKMLSKMQAILCKLASKEVTLSTDSGLTLQLNKTESYGDAREEQTTKAINCRITKPELINNFNAEFHYTHDNKKYVATLDITSGYEKIILKHAIDQQAVDIEFDYTENINAPRKYKGTLISFNLAEQPILETVTEDLF